MPSVDLGAEMAPAGQQASARRNPAQAHCLGTLPGRELPGPLSMLSGLGSQQPTLHSDALLHPCNVQLHLGNSLSQLGHLLPERLASRLCLLEAQEQITSAGVRIGHHRNRRTRQGVTGQPHPRITPWLLHPSHHPCWVRPLRSLAADASGAPVLRDQTGPDPRYTMGTHKAGRLGSATGTGGHDRYRGIAGQPTSAAATRRRLTRRARIRVSHLHHQGPWSVTRVLCHARGRPPERRYTLGTRKRRAGVTAPSGAPESSHTAVRPGPSVQGLCTNRGSGSPLEQGVLPEQPDQGPRPAGSAGRFRPTWRPGGPGQARPGPVDQPVHLRVVVLAGVVVEAERLPYALLPAANVPLPKVAKSRVSPSG
jgi:hypothetical protein